MPRPYSFPKPGEIASRYDSCMRPRIEMLALFEQETQTKASNLSKEVRQWIRNEAIALGWSDVIFPMDYGKNKQGYYGAVFIA